LDTFSVESPDLIELLAELVIPPVLRDKSKKRSLEPQCGGGNALDVCRRLFACGGDVDVRRASLVRFHET
jgi:hypothetical protein